MRLLIIEMNNFGFIFGEFFWLHVCFRFKEHIVTVRTLAKKDPKQTQSCNKQLQDFLWTLKV